MDPEDADATIKYPIRDRDGTCPILFDRILGEAGIQPVSRWCSPGPDAAAERDHAALGADLRREPPDRTPIGNERHLRDALHGVEQHDHAHCPTKP